MVKVVEELAIDNGGTDSVEAGEATGDNSTSPRGPRKMGLDEEPIATGVEVEEEEALATGGVGTMRGGVKP